MDDDKPNRSWPQPDPTNAPHVQTPMGVFPSMGYVQVDPKHTQRLKLVVPPQPAGGYDLGPGKATMVLTTMEKPRWLTRKLMAWCFQLYWRSQEEREAEYNVQRFGTPWPRTQAATTPHHPV